MHELSIIENIIKIIIEIAREKQLQQVNAVHLKVGRLRQIVPEFLEFAFDAAKNGTLANDAKLYIISVPIIMRCRNCEHEFTVEESTYICPDCDSSNLETISGNEIVIESIEGA